MKNYENLIKEIICDKFMIVSSDFKQIISILYQESGINVCYEYYNRDEIFRVSKTIYNSEINAYIFEQSFKK